METHPLLLELVVRLRPKWAGWVWAVSWEPAGAEEATFMAAGPVTAPTLGPGIAPAPAAAPVAAAIVWTLIIGR